VPGRFFAEPALKAVRGHCLLKFAREVLLRFCGQNQPVAAGRQGADRRPLKFAVEFLLWLGENRSLATTNFCSR
jgi:hypothetical protein